jgi:hypothetical protein
MRHHRLLILLFAATLLTAAAVAFTSAARANRFDPTVGIEPIPLWTISRA